ncbi:unnamed protein product [Leptosia nina]|uniref:Uncharacterized protein n=1 Tax=Leptosia nina TaxID=320188 RepID=A0AAV1JDQ3_9NEOP
MNQRYGFGTTGVKIRRETRCNESLIVYNGRSSVKHGFCGRTFLYGRGLIMCILWLCVLGITSVGASEFPERECCDPVYPPATATTSSPPVTHPVGKVAGEL